MKAPLRAHAHATLVIRENENVCHLPIPPVEPIDDFAVVASALRTYVTLCRRSLAAVSASFLGGRARVTSLPFTVKT